MNEAPTILQVLPALNSGGVERGTVEISRAIVNAGWNSLVASSGGPMVADVAYSKAKHFELPLKSKNPLRIMRNIKPLMSIIKEHGVDIVHARSRAPAWSAYYAAKAAGVRFVTTFHGVYGTEPAIKKRYNSVMVKGDRIIAVSRYIRDHILRSYECDPLKLHIIHRGADLSLFQENKIMSGSLEELARAWRLPDEHFPVLLLPGRITRWKGHEFLIRALAALPHKNYTCILCGDDQGHPVFKNEMVELITALGLEECVRFAPHTKHMTEAYALSDIVLVPSIRPEAFGRVPVEAQAMGKMVITTSHGGAMETVMPNETGFLVESGNIEELTSALKYALDMPPEHREEMGRNGMRHVQENFSVEVMQNKTLSLYNSLL